MRHFLALTLILALAFPPEAGAILLPSAGAGYSRALPENLETATKGAARGTVNLAVAVGAVIGSLEELGAGGDKPGFIGTAQGRIATMQTANELMNTSPEWGKLPAGKELSGEERQRLEGQIQSTAALHGMSVDQFVFYLSQGLSGGMYNPGDPSRGIDGSTVGVNIVGKDKGFISGVEALERIFHEYGHNQYGPGNEDGAASLGGFASWYTLPGRCSALCGQAEPR